MLQTILNVYYIGVLTALGVTMLNFSKAKKQDIDPFESMKEIEKMLDELESEKLKNLATTFVERSIENKGVYFAFIMMLCMMPIVNIFFTVMGIISLVKDE